MIRYFYPLVALCFILLGTGCDDKKVSEDSLASSDSGSTTCKNCSTLRNRISVLEREKANLSQKLDASVAEKNKVTIDRDKVIADRDKAIADRDKVIADQDKVIADQAKDIKLQKMAKEETHVRYVILSVVSYVILGIGICLIGGFVLMLRNKKKKTSESVIDNLHCPRCGWEYAVGENFCKNCKTHF